MNEDRKPPGRRALISIGQVTTLIGTICSAFQKSAAGPVAVVLSENTPNTASLLADDSPIAKQKSISPSRDRYRRSAYRLLAVWMMLSRFDGASEGLFEYHKPDAMSTFDQAFFVFQWILLFLPGVGAGIAGIYKLARQYWSGCDESSDILHTVTWVFVGVFSAMVAIAIIAVAITTLLPRKAKAEAPPHVKRDSSYSAHSEEEKRASAADPQTASAPQTAAEQGTAAIADKKGNPGRLVAVLGLAGGWDSLEGKAGLDGPGFFNRLFRITSLAFGISLIIAYVLGTAYADWMIGIAANNVVSVPRERVLGGVYFAAKHLSMLLF
ncbi:hypothetical protein HWV62_39033 [Athelia sp. TMB]|nr:hypothetical protein HWV62_39033 [Athelia sp. TMB]